jgi:hypothetical protein
MPEPDQLVSLGTATAAQHYSGANLVVDELPNRGTCTLEALVIDDDFEPTVTVQVSKGRDVEGADIGALAIL